MAREEKHLREALRRRSDRLAQAKKTLWEREIMVAAREAQVGMRKGQLERREEDLRRREEQLRRRESKVHTMQLELESKEKQMWEKVASGKHAFFALFSSKPRMLVVYAYTHTYPSVQY